MCTVPNGVMQEGSKCLGQTVQMSMLVWAFLSACCFFQDSFLIVQFICKNKLSHSISHLPLALWVKFSADNILEYFSQITGVDISQIVSMGDNLHEMSNPVFWEK